MNTDYCLGVLLCQAAQNLFALLVALVIIFRHKYIDLKKLEANKHVVSEELWSLIINSSKKRKIQFEREKNHSQWKLKGMLQNAKEVLLNFSRSH